jgi:hypothetical protein
VKVQGIAVTGVLKAVMEYYQIYRQVLKKPISAFSRVG